MHNGIDSVEARLLEVLRLGAYQLLYMDGVPDYAAISESVDLARAVRGSGAAGMANAVLRRVRDAGDAEELFPSRSEDPAAFLATWGSHPRWLVDRWLSRWSFTDVARLVAIDNRRPPVHVVPLDISVAEGIERLEAAGLSAQSSVLDPECILLAAGTKPRQALDVVGRAFVQDPAAHLVTRYADVEPGTKVADLCAAPGGKALAVSRRAGFLLGADRSESRMSMVRENAERTNTRLSCVVADARRPPFREMDAVLLDVPCTGTGTLSRHPDSRWRLQPDSVMELATVQRELLEAAADVVAPGGLLVYSTCTLEQEENEDRVGQFLDRHPNFRVEATDAVSASLLNAHGHLVVTPQATDSDGAFAARFRRVS